MGPAPTANVAIAAEGLVVIDIDGADNLWLHDDPDRYRQLAIGPMGPRRGAEVITCSASLPEKAGAAPKVLAPRSIRVRMVATLL